MPQPDCFLRYHFSAATRNFASGKSDVYVGLLVAAAKSAFNMVLLTEPVSRRNTFVGGTCAPPSALLVIIIRLFMEFFLVTLKEILSCYLIIKYNTTAQLGIDISVFPFVNKHMEMQEKIWACSFWI